MDHIEKLRGIRLEVNLHENWMLTPSERETIRKMITAIKESGSNGVTLNQLYKIVCDPRPKNPWSWERYRTKYLLMLLWKMRDVKIRRNNGFCLIKWRHLEKQL